MRSWRRRAHIWLISLAPLLVHCGDNTDSPVSSAAGTSGSAGTGGSAMCDPASCPSPSRECVEAICIAEACAEQPLPDGAVLPSQTAGDCLTRVCQGGLVTPTPDDLDLSDDGNDCTDDVCSAGMAVHPPKPSDTPCGANNTSYCDGAGLCSTCNTPTQCPGQDTECQTRACDGGTCGFTFMPQGTTIASQVMGDCKERQCDGAGDITLRAATTDIPDDANPCTIDTCDQQTPTHTPVAIGTACGNSLLCDGAGHCVGCLIESDCPTSTNLCLVATCNAGTCGTTNQSDGTWCDDGNACTLGDVCQAGTCMGSNPVICTAQDPCHDAGTCDPSTGACSSPSKAEGATCDDGNPCTQSDTCQSGVCTGSNPVICTDPGTGPDQCHDAVACNPTTGLCGYPSKVNGTTCDNGITCSHGACQGGNCVGAIAVGRFANMVDYAAGFQLASLAVADINGDGDADIAVAGSYDVPSMFNVLMNNGNGTFAPAVAYDMAAYPRVLLAVDVSGDGLPDMIVLNGNIYDAVSVLKNNGGGTFTSTGDYPVGNLPIAMVATDLDGDGSLDLAVLDHTNGPSHVRVLLNSGDGLFVPKLDYPTGWNSWSVVAADVNGDSKPDLAVTSYGSDPNLGLGTVSVLMNNGDGTFLPKVDYTTGVHPGGVTAGDVNGDGKPDLAVTNNTSNTVSVLMNNGDGTFAPKLDYPTSSFPSAVIAVDLSGDGKLDLAITDYYANSISVLTNNGDGTFAPQSDYLVHSSPLRLAAADFNGDGKLDLAISYYSNSNSVSVLLNTGCP